MSRVVDRPGRMKRLLTNFSWLAGGRVTGALMSLAATALAARALGAAEFGLVVMIHAAALMVKSLTNVKTSDAVIRYGVPLAEENRIGELKGLLLRIVRVDVVAGAVAAIIGGLILVLAADRFELPAELKAPAALYVGVMLVSVIGAARGTLRLLDKFGALSVQLTVGPALKLAAVGIVLMTPYAAETWIYVLIWGGAYLAEHVYTWWRAFRAFKNNYGDVRSLAPELDRSDVRSFLYTTYWQSTLDAAPKQAATLLAGTLLGTAGAALFSLARELAEVLAKPVTLLRQVVFPDLARLWRNDVPRFIRVTWRTGAVTACVGLVVVGISAVAAEPILVGLAGDDFGAASTLLTLLLLAASINLAGASFQPAAYVIGRARALLNVQVLATGVYLSGFLIFVDLYGLEGIGLAAGLSGVVGFIGAGALVHTGCRARLKADRRSGLEGAAGEA